MPELPEVETIVTELKPKLKGKKIKNFSSDRAKQLNLPVSEFKKKVIGQTIKNVNRRAKMIIIDLSEDRSLLIHLKLTGQLILRNETGQLSGGGHFVPGYLKKLPNQFTHAIFTFTDEQKLFFNDMRLFGYIKLVSTQELPDIFAKIKLGPEPFDQSLTFAKFKQMIEQRKIAKIKPLLMDQTFLAGLGNIYSDEVLFYAGVRPDRIAGFIKESELKKIYEGIYKILKEAIKHHGTSVDTYVDASGTQGSYEPKLQVYGRKKEKCLKCQTPLQSMKLGGRTTVFCPLCQK